MALRRWCHGGRALRRRRRLPAQTRSLNSNGAEADGPAASSADRRGVRGGRFVFLGAPGVGKGTFAAIIAPQMGLRVVSTGDLIRAALLKGQQQQHTAASPASPAAALPALSASEQETVRGGGLLPDHTVLALVQAALLLPPLQHQPAAAGGGPPGAGGGGADAGGATAGFILDGFPRTVAQALALESMLSSSCSGPGSGLAGVVSIELAEWVAVTKVLGRRLCSLCGRGFNSADVTSDGFDMPAIPPPPPGQCSGSKGRPCPVHSPGGLVRRDDDTEQVVRRRLQVHRDSTAPLLRFYEARGLLVRFQVKKGVKDAPQLRHIMTNMLLQQQQQAAAVAGGGPPPHSPWQ